MREAWANCSRRAKNPRPVSDVNPSPAGGLFYPSASTVADRCYVTISGMLNPG
jgi:hypothetical protein